MPGKARKGVPEHFRLTPAAQRQNGSFWAFLLWLQPNPEKKEIVDERGYLRASAVDFRDL